MCVCMSAAMGVVVFGRQEIKILRVDCWHGDSNRRIGKARCVSLLPLSLSWRLNSHVISASLHKSSTSYHDHLNRNLRKDHSSYFLTS